MADALISIAEISGKQMSSKFFDYMSFKKPIIHIYYDEKDVNLKYLSLYSDSFYINANESIDDMALWLSIFLKIKTGMNNSPKYDRELYKCTPKYVCEQIVESIPQKFLY